jgi:hypothetical protein
MYAITPIARPTTKPIKFRIFSSKNSNYAHYPLKLIILT